MAGGDLTSISDGSPAATPSSGESPVGRAFRLLQTVVAAGESVGVLELSRRSGLPRSTVSRLVGILTELGMVARTADGAVIPGSALSTLQPGGRGASNLADQLRPLLTEIVQSFGENVALSVDDGDALLYLSQVIADNAVSVPEVTGARHPHHVVAPGLLTMAWWSDRELDVRLAAPLEPATSHSMTDPKAIRARLHAVRSDGWCWTDQELDVGVNGLAVPVLDGERLIATISLFGPSYRLNPDDRPTLAGELLELATSRAAALLA
jgi:IclR family acetate operon transcriptional repressor